MDWWLLIGPLVSIVVLDLVLSGDNAVVIGMATNGLPVAQRKRAIVLGGAAAVVLRIGFTVVAAYLLSIPLLMAAGGVLLAWIALKLLRQQEAEEEHLHESNTMFDAVRTIILADVVMSLDNMLAVGGAAHGHFGLLLFGLLLSIPILLLGSGLVAKLLDRFPWLSWFGAAILAWTAGAMVADDPILSSYLEQVPGLTTLLPGVMIVLVVAIGLRGVRASRTA